MITVTGFGEVFVPALVSEREPDGSWEDCTWAGGVMLANFMLGANVHPATRTEYEALRKAGTGTAEVDGKGSNIGDLDLGMRRRYKFTGTIIESWSEFATYPAGVGVSIQGKYSALPARLRRTGFTGAHNVCAIRDDSDFVWLDPLGVKGEAPRRATIAEVRRYFEALPGARMLAAMPLDAYRRDGMLKLNLQRWRAPKGTPIFEFPKGPKVTAMAETKEITTLGFFMDRVKDTSPYVVGGWRAIVVNSIAIDGTKAPKIAAIRTADLTAVTSPGGWDDNLWKLLTGPGLLVVDKVTAGGGVVSEAALTAAHNAGVTEAAAAALTAKKGA